MLRIDCTSALGDWPYLLQWREYSRDKIMVLASGRKVSDLTVDAAK